MPRTVTVHASMHELPAAAWDACAGSANPSVSHAFLAALEASGSATPRTGWTPRHLAVWEDGALVGVVPAWAKSHSWGEYVFDHGWAEAWERAGHDYYPKLLAAVPFTPVPGPRLLTRDPAVRAALPALLAASGEGLSSVHVNFLTEPDRAAFAAAGWLLREGFQFHWHNQGYPTFDDWLGTLTSKRRKEVRRERAGAAAHGLVLRDLPGSEVSEALWDQVHGLYLANANGRWGQPYLTRDFFRRLTTLGDRVLLGGAFDGPRLVAMALHLVGEDTLYGRNWGASVRLPYLHFELCYYRAIDHAIARGLARVEAGAQGEHKLARGYLPTPTWSAHWIPDPRFREAVADFLRRETKQVDHAIALYGDHAPYREE